MGVEIRLPNITGVTEREQLLQLKSYLYQLSEQLQWAFDNINTAGGTSGGYVVNQSSRGFTGSSGTSGGSSGISFSELKALIIKSADIVEAYYEEISKKLEGVYVAQSDFGIFAEKTSQEIEATSTAITQNFENVQIIIQNKKEEIDGEFDLKIGETVSALNGKILDATNQIADTNSAIETLGDGLNAAEDRIAAAEGSLEEAKTNINSSIQTVANSVSSVDKLLESAKAQLQGSLEDLGKDVDAFKSIMTEDGEAVVIGVSGQIKSGVLYYTEGANPVPVIGIEIGQKVTDADGNTVFNKFARFISEKLSFYDANGIEVAYISDKKLYIGQAEITTSLKVGGLVDLVMANGDVVTKWEGV